MKHLALFDFDHCLTTKDSFLDFLKYCFSSTEVYFQLSLLTPYLVSQNEAKAKELLVQRLFKSWSADQMRSYAESYVHYRLPDIINEPVLEDLKEQCNKGEAYIVSASLDLWLLPWCMEYGVGLICTEFDLESRKLSSPNCKGEEKVRRIKEKLNLENYQHIYAVGNLPQDRSMLDLADQERVIK